MPLKSVRSNRFELKRYTGMGRTGDVRDGEGNSDKLNETTTKGCGETIQQANTIPNELQSHNKHKESGVHQRNR